MKRLHPTILVGYGDYGRTVLERLLRSASARGALEWEERDDPTSLQRRQLRGLALLYAADPLDPRSRDERPPEVMLDLFRQIEEVETGPFGVGEALASAAGDAKRRLQAAAAHGFDRGQGLDVFVLAHPSRAEAVGKLQEVMEPMLREVSQGISFTRVKEGTDQLNFLQFLDFDDYWRDEAEHNRIRDALAHALERNSNAAQRRDPAFGRIYLFDSETRGGHRDRDARIDEAALFLEFLLFEGQRQGDNERLYQRDDDGAPAAALVGVRGIQLSFGLVSRLSAASYSRLFLDYLIQRGETARREPLTEMLQAFLPERLEQTLGLDRIEALRQQGLDEIESKLMSLDPTAPDWPQQVAEEWKRSIWALKDHISHEAGRESRELSEQRLGPLREQLEGAVLRELDAVRDPLTVGQLLDQIERYEPQLRYRPQELPQQSDAAPEPFAGIAERHQEYLQFQQGRVRMDQLADKWWPLLGIVFALAAGPFAIDALGEFFTLEGLAGQVAPVAVLVVFWLIAWQLGRRVFHRSIQQRSNRADDFYRHRQRGRLTDAVRAATRSSALQQELLAHTDNVTASLRMRVLGDVLSELLRVKELLARRAREIDWLIDQLGKFLDTNGVDSSKPQPRFDGRRRGHSALTQLERNEDLAAVFGQRTAEPTHFGERQTKLNLFESWSTRYCEEFLRPLAFLDKLSADYRDPIHSGGGEGPSVSERERAEALGEAIKLHAKPPLGFFLLRAPTDTTVVRSCVFPKSWLNLPGVINDLSEAGYQDPGKTESSARAYLLEVQLGVSTELLQTGRPS